MISAFSSDDPDVWTPLIMIILAVSAWFWACGAKPEQKREGEEQLTFNVTYRIFFSYFYFSISIFAYSTVASHPFWGFRLTRELENFRRYHVRYTVLVFFLDFQGHDISYKKRKAPRVKVQYHLRSVIPLLFSLNLPKFRTLFIQYDFFGLIMVLNFEW